MYLFQTSKLYESNVIVMNNKYYINIRYMIIKEPKYVIIVLFQSMPSITNIYIC